MHSAMAALRLNVPVRGLERGQHIECKSMEELLAAEDAIMEACENLKKYLDVAATFDGREMLVDFSGGAPELVAQAVRPEPILAPPTVPGELAATPAPALISALEEAPHDRTEGAAETAGVAPQPDFLASIRKGIDDAIQQISDVTGLDYRRAKLVAIGIAVFFLLLLLSMCHG